jgi:hypothetical protein
MKHVIGVDPGKHGAVAVLDPESMAIVSLHKMPETDREVVELVREKMNKASHLFIEQIPKFAGENRSAAFMAVLYGNYKLVCGAALMHGGSELVELSLLKWMNVTVEQSQRSRERSARKRQLLETAKTIWPETRLTLQTCDAPLIARAGILLSRDAFTSRE